MTLDRSWVVYYAAAIISGALAYAGAGIVGIVLWLLVETVHAGAKAMFDSDWGDGS